MLRGAMRAGLVAALLATFGCAGGPHPVTGVYSWEPEVNTFRPCGGDKTYWVAAPDEVRRTLRAAHDSLAAGPGRGILLQAMLRHSGRKPEGFARRYQGMIGVVEVLDVDATIPPRCLETSWALPGRRPGYLP